MRHLSTPGVEKHNNAGCSLIHLPLPLHRAQIIYFMKASLKMLPK